LTTVFGNDKVNPMIASADVLAALPGMERERVAAILDTRLRFPTDPGRLAGILGPAQQYVQVKPQQAVSVALAARLADGFGAAAQAVIIRLQGDSEPYRVLAWSPLPPS
jgi:general secretion pathway protein K